MSFFVELSAMLNIGRWLVKIRNWWRQGSKQKNSTSSLDSIKKETLRFNEESVISLPVGILPQKFEFVNLEKILVNLRTSGSLNISKDISVNYELRVRRVDEIEITLLLVHAKHWRTMTSSNVFHISIDTSNASGSFMGSNEFADEYVTTDKHIAFAYISYIKFKDNSEPWDIADKRKTLLEDTMKKIKELLDMEAL